MRRVLHLLIAFSVLLCGLHLTEPAQAAGLVDIEHAQSAPGDNHDTGDGADGLAHASHHHCPSAPAQRLSGAGDTILPPAKLFFARPVAALASLAQAPPLEPPAA